MMNLFRKILPLTALTAILVSLAYFADAAAPGPKLSANGGNNGNKHNLSSLNLDNTVKYKAAAGDLRGEQICIFCHTPHRANVTGHTPLWNRRFSGETFQRYTSATLRIRGIANAQYGDGAQPNGSSRLCLSCHDGVSKLGAVGPLDAAADIVMDFSNGGSDVISGLASFKPDTDKMKTGHHPVSFVYMTNFNYGVTPQTGTIHSELPAAEYRFMPISAAYKVKLFDTSRNGNGWMQCTTCHDPHQNQADDYKCYNSGGAIDVCDGITYTRSIAPFWTYHGSNTTASEDTGTVCKVCHTVSVTGFVPPWP